MLYLPAAVFAVAHLLAWPAIAIAGGAATTFLVRSLKPLMEPKREKAASVNLRSLLLLHRRRNGHLVLSASIRRWFASVCFADVIPANLLENNTCENFCVSILCVPLACHSRETSRQTAIFQPCYLPFLSLVFTLFSVIPFRIPQSKY
jgi:hypothetical protein